MVRPRASSLTGWQCRSVKAKASALRAAIDALGSLGPGVSLQALRALRSLDALGPLDRATIHPAAAGGIPHLEGVIHLDALGIAVDGEDVVVLVAVHRHPVGVGAGLVHPAAHGGVGQGIELAAHRLAHHQHLAAAVGIHRIDQLIKPIEIERGPGSTCASTVVDRHGVTGQQALSQPVKRMERTFISIWLARASGPIRSTIERSTSTSPPNRCTASARWSTTP